MLYSLTHLTHYRYDAPVTVLPHYLRLKPCRHYGVKTFNLELNPSPKNVHWQRDLFGNEVARAVFYEQALSLEIKTYFTFSLEEKNPFSFVLESDASYYPFVYKQDEHSALQPYLYSGEDSAAFHAWVQALQCEHVYIIEHMRAVAAAVVEKVAYRQREEEGVLSCDAMLSGQAGSCRDMSWLLAQTLRSMGIATRFVAGYLLQPRENSSELDVEYHAWVECYLPGAGWVGLDATSGLLTAQYHIPVAYAHVPAGVAAVSGATSPTQATLSHEIRCDIVR